MMKISEAAQYSGLTVKAVRYYADIRLVEASERASNGYRLYSRKDIKKLIFIRKARALGFSIDQSRDLLSLFENPKRRSHEVKDLAQKHLSSIDEQMKELQSMRNFLSPYVETCPGNDSQECPILDALSKTE